MLTPLAYLWWSSLLPDEYSAMDMGYADYGGGAAVGHAGHAAGSDSVSIADLAPDPDARPDVSYSLVARAETFSVGPGREVDGYTLNGRSPGPLIEAEQGDLVQVRLVNESVPGGVTLHWHGVDVPGAMDGVAGVTQDAVQPGDSFTYRFVADAAGSYWYHSHQLSHEQVQRGLLGPLVISPRDGVREDVDVHALAHIYEGVRTINGTEGDLDVAARPGETVRVRVINSENGPSPVWVSGAEYRVLAVDGTDVHKPTPVSEQAVLVTAGGRMDLGVVMPSDGRDVRVEIAGASAVVLGDGRPSTAATSRPDTFVDLLHYGLPADVGFDTDAPDREFEYVMDRRPGFVDGRPGVWWTVNGGLFPDVPMYMVSRGDVVVMRLENNSGEVHPMHLHGHHAVVLSRDGEEATGSPWWVDSLNVEAGESYEIAFLADNPGVWMDHCHNLPHAAEGLVAHLMYAGYATPYVLGGAAGNEPE